ncbi:MAG: hypothetical protein JNL18_17130 [Planctomycetaceae bacterium]|nr:hypothetical protein [Planctomycetaceae bacterium]
MNIVEAIEDPNIFRPFLQDKNGSLDSWLPWITALRALHGLPVPKSNRELLTQITGRTKLRKGGFSTALFLTGRRSGKSRIAAVIGAFEAALAGHDRKLSKGEKGVVIVASPTKSQSRIVKDYLRACFDTPLLRGEIASETKEGFELTNGIRIEILSGDWKTIRGFTVVAAIVDEVCFFGLDVEAKIKSDTELIRAIRPSLATVGGKLIAISSPYAPRGWSYRTYTNNFGNDSGDTLVLNAPSRTMNCTLPQAIVDQALKEDPAAARAEYLGEWRADVNSFIPRELVESLVVKGRNVLPPEHGTAYGAFVDISGGRSDDAALCIAHKAESGKIVLDFLRRWSPPFNPDSVIREMVDCLARYHIDRVVGDNYSAEFTKQAFESRGVLYERATTSDWKADALAPPVAKPKSQLYAELLPRLCSGEIELLDNETLINQLANLERRTRSGGRDIIDHPPGQHDDLANVVAGVCDVAVHAPPSWESLYGSMEIGPDGSIFPSGAGGDPSTAWSERLAQYERERITFEQRGRGKTWLDAAADGSLIFNPNVFFPQ